MTTYIWVSEKTLEVASSNTVTNKKHTEFADWSAASSTNFPRSSILFSEGTKDGAFIAAEISFPGSGTTIQRVTTN